LFALLDLRSHALAWAGCGVTALLVSEMLSAQAAAPAVRIVRDPNLFDRVWPADTSLTTPAGLDTAPVWLQLSRRGNVVYTYWRKNFNQFWTLAPQRGGDGNRSVRRCAGQGVLIEPAIYNWKFTIEIDTAPSFSIEHCEL
jgi:hypothetical protein